MTTTLTVTPATDLQTARQKLMAIRAHLNTQIQERSEEIDGVLIALIARAHTLFLGEPGIAKSLTLELVCKSIVGAKLFTVQMTRFTKPDDLFGPIDLLALENGEQSYVKKNTIREAHIAFLDEVFKANSAILNANLRVMNERKFTNGTAGEEDLPLVSLFSASNELPQGEDLSAMFDRFLLKFNIQRIQGYDSLLTMITGTPTVGPTMTLDELVLLQQAADDVDITDYAPFHRDLAFELRDKKFWISDRKIRESVKLVRAAAVLAGETKAMPHHARILKDAFWLKPEEVRAIRKIVIERFNPNEAFAINIMDACQDVYEAALRRRQEIQSDMVVGTNIVQETNAKLREGRQALEERLNAIGAGHAQAGPVQAAIKQVKKYIGAVAQLVTGTDDE